MAGAMRKVGVYPGLLEDTDRYEDDYYEDDHGNGETGESNVVERSPSARPVQPVRDDRPRDAAGSSRSVASLAERRRPQQQVAELSRITTLHPSNYNEARTIGEHF